MAVIMAIGFSTCQRQVLDAADRCIAAGGSPRISKDGTAFMGCDVPRKAGQ